MISIYSSILSKNKLTVTIIGGMLLSNTYITDSYAQNLDANYVLNKMNADEQVGFIAGVVEGLAFSRWQRDRPDETGLECIYRWHGKKDKWNDIEQWFARHPTRQVGPLLYILIKKDCGA